MQFALTDVFAVPVATATGVALLAHAVSFVPISLIGFALFATSPLRKKRLEDLAAEPESSAEPIVGNPRGRSLRRKLAVR